jgi:hypothetical protein
MWTSAVPHGPLGPTLGAIRQNHLKSGKGQVNPHSADDQHARLMVHRRVEDAHPDNRRPQHERSLESGHHRERGCPLMPTA